MVFYIGVRIETSNKISKIKEITSKIDNKEMKSQIFDFNINGKVIINKQNDIITAGGKQESKHTGMINFALLHPLEVEDIDMNRIVRIVNVLGNGRLLKERVKTFIIGHSVLNKLSEFNELNNTFNYIEKIIPGFIENAWYYAPETKLK
jgi:uncharacterized FAD-dependent dehydrogenase